jgi:hypothetical protein
MCLSLQDWQSNGFLCNVKLRLGTHACLPVYLTLAIMTVKCNLTLRLTSLPACSALTT